METKPERDHERESQENTLRKAAVIVLLGGVGLLVGGYWQADVSVRAPLMGVGIVVTILSAALLSGLAREERPVNVPVSTLILALFAGAAVWIGVLAHATLHANPALILVPLAELAAAAGMVILLSGGSTRR